MSNFAPVDLEIVVECCEPQATLNGVFYVNRHKTSAAKPAAHRNRARPQARKHWFLVRGRLCHRQRTSRAAPGVSIILL